MYTTRIWWHQYDDPDSPLVVRTSKFARLEDAESEVQRYQAYVSCECEIENRHGDVLYFDSKKRQTFYKHQEGKNTAPEHKDKGEKEHE